MFNLGLPISLEGDKSLHSSIEGSRAGGGGVSTGAWRRRTQVETVESTFNFSRSEFQVSSCLSPDSTIDIQFPIYFHTSGEHQTSFDGKHRVATTAQPG